ncbi:hypothetical protein ACT6QG_03735 [Xanthobacter sp. TB0136]|uniref:hypothetical protein n=1 Tax=Xanthobacter sp. TB0136 TaxID=3459177 RepID=UPI004039ABF1
MRSDDIVAATPWGILCCENADIQHAEACATRQPSLVRAAGKPSLLRLGVSALPAFNQYSL